MKIFESEKEKLTYEAAISKLRDNNEELTNNYETVVNKLHKSEANLLKEKEEKVIEQRKVEQLKKNQLKN